VIESWRRHDDAVRLASGRPPRRRPGHGHVLPL